MNKRIVDRINELKFHTTTSVINNSRRNLPHLKDLNLSRVYEYYLEGKRYTPPNIDSKIFMTQADIYTSLEKDGTVYQTSLKEAIEKYDVYPLLFFIDGKFVKWSEITLVKDHFYSYFIFEDIERDDPDPNIKCVLIPKVITKYTEMNKNPTDYTFLFDNTTGLYSIAPSENKLYTSIYVNNDSVECFKNTIDIVDRFYIPSDYNIQPENIICFKDGMISMTNINKLPLNVFEFDGNENGYIDIVSFAYKFGNNLVTLDSDIIDKDEAVDMILNHENDSQFLNMKENFDFEFNDDNSKDNMMNALRYIMNYDARLMNKVYEDKSMIKSIIKSSSDLIKAKDTKGLVHLSTSIDIYRDCKIILFKNGYLFEGYKNGIYKNHEFIFSLDSMKTDDIFEILYIINIDNNIYQTRLYSGDMSDEMYLDPDIDVNDLLITSPSIHEPYYNFEVGNHILHEVEYEAERINSDKIHIILKDPFYYDKLLYFGSKRQFRYMCQYNNYDEPITEMDLNDDFKLCINKEQYLVFINGVYISPGSYDIIIPNKEDPIYQMRIYFSQDILPKDRVEIIYIGNIFSKVYNNEAKIETSGNIILDSNKLKYPFGKNIYSIFIDGKKILPSEIKNINSHMFKITSNDIINNVSVIQHVKEDELLYSFFNNNTDLLEDIVSAWSPEEIDKLYPGIVSSEIKENQYFDHDRVLRIIRDYWMKLFINNGEEIPINFGPYTEDGQIVDTGNLLDDQI